MRRVVAFTDAAIMGVVVLLWAVFFVCVVAQVFVRYVLQFPLPWTDELARYTFIWSSFRSASVILLCSWAMSQSAAWVSRSRSS